MSIELPAASAFVPTPILHFLPEITGHMTFFPGTFIENMAERHAALQPATMLDEQNGHLNDRMA
jgi:hypothetical protein